MKNHITFLLLFISTFSYSQQWPAQNAEWTYCVGPIPIDWAQMCCAGPQTWHYVNDTLINGEIYNITKNINSVDLSNENGAYYTRYSNDTVYRYINNSEYLYFHFNLHMNEVFTTYRSLGGSSDTSCTSILPLKVIDTATVTINQEVVTKWTLKDTLGITYSNGVEYFHEFELYEKYGFASSLHFTNPWELQNCQLITDIGYSYIAGYNDDSTNEWIASCPTAEIEEKEDNVITIFPNPFSNNLSFSTKTEGTMTLYDINGKTIKQVNLIKSETYCYDFNNLERGLYFYEFKNKTNHILKRGKIIKN
jgi:hypothetical protein